MSASYTLHLGKGYGPGDPRALEASALVPDGFSWGAFLVPALWFARHGHWLLALLAALGVGLFGWGLSKLGMGTGAVLVCEILLHLLIGLEAASLRRFAYELRGRPVADIVMAGNLAEAETKAFARYLDDGPTASAATPRPPELRTAGASTYPAQRPFSGRRDAEQVIGLFPDIERSR